MFDIKNKLKEVEREEFSHDASIFKVKPQDTFSVDNFDLVSSFIKEGKPFSVRAAGTCMSGGSLTDTNVIHIKPIKKFLLNQEEILKIKNIKLSAEEEFKNISEGEIWVQSNVYTRDLLKELERENKFFAPYTSSKNICMIGGMLGNNASGEKSLTYGPTSKNVSEIKIILNTKELLGEIYHAKEKEITL